MQLGIWAGRYLFTRCRGFIISRPHSDGSFQVPGEGSLAQQLTRCPGQEVDGSVPAGASQAAEREHEGTGGRARAGMREAKASAAAGLGKEIAPVFTTAVPVRVGVPCPK